MLPFVIILLVAGVGLVMVGRKLELQAHKSATWPKVAGVLEYCEVVQVPDMRSEDVSSWELGSAIRTRSGAGHIIPIATTDECHDVGCSTLVVAAMATLIWIGGR